jgi:[ribosomal protein S5]-alanine N-acetyltransferase
MQPIKTKRFILRHYKKTDKSNLIKNINDKEIARFMSHIPFPYGSKEANQFLKKAMDKKRKNLINLAVEINGEVAGGTGLTIRGHQAEIGYWLAKKHWGKGLATEVAREITKYCFDKLKLKRITSKVFLSNKASARVLEKNNFKLEGILKKDIVKKGKYFDVYLYAKVK